MALKKCIRIIPKLLWKHNSNFTSVPIDWSCAKRTSGNPHTGLYAVTSNSPLWHVLLSNFPDRTAEKKNKKSFFYVEWVNIKDRGTITQARDTTHWFLTQHFRGKKAGFATLRKLTKIWWVLIALKNWWMASSAIHHQCITGIWVILTCIECKVYFYHFIATERNRAVVLLRIFWKLVQITRKWFIRHELLWPSVTSKYYRLQLPR